MSALLITRLSEDQRDEYISSVEYVLENYSSEKIQTKFEMSIDMCGISWDCEDECGEIFDSILEEWWVS